MELIVNGLVLAILVVGFVTILRFERKPKGYMLRGAGGKWWTEPVDRFDK